MRTGDKLRAPVFPLLVALCRVGALCAAVLASLAAGCGEVRREEQDHPRGAGPGEAGEKGSAPPFSVASRDGGWRLVDPGGKPFFSLGVCVVDQGIAREAYDTARPGYAAWRHHAGAAAWGEATLERLRSWGFTTVGGWSDYRALRSSVSRDLAVTPVLAAGMEAGVPWFDLWDPAVVARVEDLARGKIRAARDHPKVLGYYTDNEIGWWNGALFKMTLEHPAGSGQRRRLVELLRETYRGNWEALLEDFDPEGAASFAGLEEKGILYLRPGGGGIRAARRFLELAAVRYYELLGDMVRRHHPRALVLGDRYQSFYYPEVVRAAARQVDVVSTNLNAQWSDGTFARFYLDTLHQLSGKPVLVSEFYLAASENRSGNPNDRGLYPVARTQEERVQGFRTTLSALLALPYVVGADWFQYYDEPPGGRFDGENFNFGLVDIHDRPYEELAAAAREMGAAARELAATRERPTRKRPDAREGIPPAPPDPSADFLPNLALRAWDRERGFVPPASAFPLADLYLVWDREALHLGLLSLDPVEGAYYRDGRVPEIDRMEWVVELDGLREPARIRLGAGQPPSGVPPGMTAACLSGKEVGVRVVAHLRVAAGLLGRQHLVEGDAIRLASTITTHARAERVEWRGEFRLSR